MEIIKLEKLKTESIESVELGKAFHLYQRRNEWANWNGDTNLVSRSWRIRLFLCDAKQSAENLRTPGTKFFIDEVPIIYIKSMSGSLVITEIFSEKPMWAYLNTPISPQDVKSIGSLLNKIPGPKWAVKLLQDKHVPITPIDDLYYSRYSSPGRGQNSMAWSLKPRSLDDTAIKIFADDIKKLRLHHAQNNV